MTDLLAIELQAGVPERPGRPARPPAVRLCGPLGGAFTTPDPAVLRHEAARLTAAADALAHARAEFDPTPGRLRLDAGP